MPNRMRVRNLLRRERERTCTDLWVFLGSGDPSAPSADAARPPWRKQAESYSSQHACSRARRRSAHSAIILGHQTGPNNRRGINRAPRRVWVFFFNVICISALESLAFRRIFWMEDAGARGDVEKSPPGDSCVNLSLCGVAFRPPLNVV